MKYVYTSVCPPVREIIHSLMVVDYLLIQKDKPLYNYYKLDGGSKSLNTKSFPILAFIG